MSFEPETVLKLAQLARLHVTQDEVQQYADELSAILEFIEQMNTVDTDGVIPMAHPLDMVQPLRPDVVSEVDQRAEHQANAPMVRNGLYIVPIVIE